MYTPHTVTLVNAVEANDATVTYHLTILAGVMLQGAKSASASKLGLADADSVTLFIPFNVRASGVSGGNKRFLGPVAYESASDKDSFWTLKSGGRSGASDCFFIKGIVTEPIGYGAALERYDEVYRVTSVDSRDFGSQFMRHWQVGGK